MNNINYYDNILKERFNISLNDILNSESLDLELDTEIEISLFRFVEDILEFIDMKAVSNIIIKDKNQLFLDFFNSILIEKNQLLVLNGFSVSKEAQKYLEKSTFLLDNDDFVADDSYYIMDGDYKVVNLNHDSEKLFMRYKNLSSSSISFKTVDYSWMSSLFNTNNVFYINKNKFQSIASLYETLEEYLSEKFQTSLLKNVYESDNKQLFIKELISYTDDSKTLYECSAEILNNTKTYEQTLEEFKKDISLHLKNGSRFELNYSDINNIQYDVDTFKTHNLLDENNLPYILITLPDLFEDIIHKEFFKDNCFHIDAQLMVKEIKSNKKTIDIETLEEIEKYLVLNDEEIFYFSRDIRDLPKSIHRSYLKAIFDDEDISIKSHDDTSFLYEINEGFTISPKSATLTIPKSNIMIYAMLHLVKKGIVEKDYFINEVYDINLIDIDELHKIKKDSLKATIEVLFPNHNESELDLELLQKLLSADNFNASIIKILFCKTYDPQLLEIKRVIKIIMDIDANYTMPSITTPITLDMLHNLHKNLIMFIEESYNIEDDKKILPFSSVAWGNIFKCDNRRFIEEEQDEIKFKRKHFVSKDGIVVDSSKHHMDQNENFITLIPSIYKKKKIIRGVRRY